MCQRLSDDLRRFGIQADCIHGDIAQQKREKTMRTFKEGKLPVLIATDVASRGIDVDDVDCVINYDVPEENEYYIHRIGRTGRAKKKGIAVSILGTFPEQAKLSEIAKYSHYQIQPVKFLEDGTLVEEAAEGEKAAAAPEVPPVRQTERGLLLLCLSVGRLRMAGALESRAGAGAIETRARGRHRRRRPAARCYCQRTCAGSGTPNTEAGHIVALLRPGAAAGRISCLRRKRRA